MSSIKFLFQKYRLESLNKSLCKNSAITAYLEINLDSKLIFQEDKITQHCRQLSPKGRKTYSRERMKNIPFNVFTSCVEQNIHSCRQRSLGTYLSP